MKELTLEITNRCSLSCMHCSTVADKKGGIFFSLEKIEQYLESFPDSDVVRLSGGEPFEHPLIIEAAELIHDEGKKAHILSCGVQQGNEIPDRVIEEISPFLEEIIFSIHGCCSGHDQIVTPGEDWKKEKPYSCMMNSAYNAYLAGLPLSFQTVLMRQNYGCLEEIAKEICRLEEYAKQRPKWHILRFVRQGRGALHPEQALGDDEIEKLPVIARTLSEKYNIPITYSASFEQEECRCSEKAVVTCYDEVIQCSALKYGADPRGEFPCRPRL